jgi:AraC-like DNA-binding protein
MHATALASTHLLLVRAVESYGLDPLPLFRAVGLDPSRVSEAEARYSEDQSTRLLQRIVEVTGDPCFGLRVARYWHPSSLHGLGFAWLASHTLKEAIERLVRYFRILIVGERLRLDELPEVFRVSVETPPEYPRGPDMLYDMIFAVLINMCRESYRQSLDPVQVSLRRAAPSCQGEYFALFKAPVTFGALHDCMELPKQALLDPLPTANVDMARASEALIGSYLASLDRSEVAVSVKAKLVEMLPSGGVTERAVAEVLHLSLRSLQRKLAAEGTGFKAILDETRRDLAVQYVQQSRYSVSEISYLLGFSELSNFSRAFKRWTGQSPSAYRAAA